MLGAVSAVAAQTLHRKILVPRIDYLFTDRVR